MLLDLWSFAIILNDILEFVIYWAEHETFTVSFGLATLTFFILAYFAWRSTDIPHDVPPPPRPPFIITIQGSTINSGPRRQSLSDVRILTSNSTPYNLNRDGHGHSGGRRSTGTTTSTSVNSGVQTREANQTSPEVTSQQPRSSGQIQIPRPRPTLGLHGTAGSLLFGFLRRRTVTRPILPTRPLLRTRFSQGPNLVVYHRIYHPTSQASPVQEVSPSVNSESERQLGDSEVPDVSQGSPDQVGLLEIDPSDSVSVSEGQVLPGGSEHIDDSTPSNSVSARSGNQNSTDTSQLDSCRILERSYSDSDLSLSELAYSSSELTPEEMDTSRKSESPQNPDRPHLNQEDPGHDDVKFTLKFLNDTQKDVTTQFNEKIGDFKRRHFSTELGENKIVRLIFNGRVLDNDSKTLRESGIFDQCVVHCLIVTPQPTQQSQGSGSQSSQRYGSGNRSGPRGPEPGMFFVSFMGIILVFLWFICFNFGQQLFTQSAVVSLSVLTAIFLVGLIAFYLPVHPNQPNVNS